MAEDMDTEIEDNITGDITVGIKFKPVVSSPLKPVEGMIFHLWMLHFYVIKAVFRYKMVFVPFTGIDNHFRNVNLGAGLIAKEPIESYTWLGPHCIPLIPDEFEVTWHEIVNEFGLIDNSWISTMFGLRLMWIPAYYHNEPLSGLMHTTSRSESENQIVGLVSNSQLTLLEFFSHFDMALETQRYAHRKNDHDTMNTKPGEYGPNAKIYVKDKEAFGKGFLQVSVIVADNDFSASCSCKRFEQYGLLCRHVFVAFSVFEIDEIPKKYILRRWMRDAVSNNSKCSIFGKDVANGNIDKANEIVRDIMFATENICNMLFIDIEALNKVRDQINSMREGRRGFSS
ncbi:protein FAR1-RELATED SEQUENCE 3-like [Bidens hawaiensis]|uniref:protein FAR1-RELATED SEQUENCE 3-like n=1 Tax=Bidens hawaiensis TaxID=980011 RepID=UPI00404B2384